MRSGITRLLLIGAGPAHLAVLDGLARHHPGDLQVTLLAPWPHHTHTALLPSLIAGQRSEAQARTPLPPRVQAAHARWLAGRCLALDADTRTVHWQAADGPTPPPLGYDLLSLDPVIALDRERLAARLPGAREHALALWPLDGFLHLWPDVVALAQRQPVSLAVIGAGSAAVETAFAAAERLRRDGLPGSTFTLITGPTGPVPGLPTSARTHVNRRLQRAGIQVLREPCVAVDAQGVHLGNGALLRCDVPVIAEDGEAPAWLADSGLALGEHGHVRVNRFLQSSSHANVFACGEAAERDDLPAAPPRNLAQALRAAPVLAHNLRAAHEGQAFKPHWPPQTTRLFVACGSSHAVAAWGPWWLRGRWVRHWKDRIDRRDMAAPAGAPANPDATDAPQQGDARPAP